ncbi:MAG: hypothetical protein PHH11_07715 [Methylomonas sp.]|nr:hypothetical protein [Methylomonas sp.]
MIKLSSEQRHFFQQIADLAFINPFSKKGNRLIAAYRPSNPEN